MPLFGFADWVRGSVYMDVLLSLCRCGIWMALVNDILWSCGVLALLFVERNVLVNSLRPAGHQRLLGIGVLSGRLRSICLNSDSCCLSLCIRPVHDTGHDIDV